MSEVEQLEQRIGNLSVQDFAKLRAWFIEFDTRVCDEQIEVDAKCGKLDRFVAEALADYKAGKARDL